MGSEPSQRNTRRNDNLDDRWWRLAVVGVVLARLGHLLLLLLVHWRRQHPVLDEEEKNDWSGTSASSFKHFTNDEAGDAYGHHWIPHDDRRSHGNSTHGYHN